MIFIKTLIYCYILIIRSHLAGITGKLSVNFNPDLTNEPFHLTNVEFMRGKVTIPDTKFVLWYALKDPGLAGFLIAVWLITNFRLWLIDWVDGKKCLDIQS